MRVSRRHAPHFSLNFGGLVPLSNFDLTSVNLQLRRGAFAAAAHRALLASVAIAFLGAPPARADLGGLRSTVHVLTHVKIVTHPGAAAFEGTIVIREGRIAAVGPRVPVPPEAIVHDLPGRLVYPGLVEPYLRLDSKSSGKDSAKDDASAKARRSSALQHENTMVHPEERAVDALPLPEKTLEELRRAGFAAAHLVPGHGVFRGKSGVISLGVNRDPNTPFGIVHEEEFAQVFAFEHGNWEANEYPSSLMGAIALARQSLLDAGWSREAWTAYRRDPAHSARPEANASLEALLPVVDRTMPVVFECEDVPMMERALKLAKEFRLRGIYVTGGSDEWRDIDWVRKQMSGAIEPLVVSVNFPEVPIWTDPEDRESIPLDDLIQWERAPGNLAVLEKAGVSMAITTQGLKSRGEVFDRVREAVEAGLSPATALAGMTTVPARLLGIEARAGTIATGKDANLLVTTGELFQRGTEVEETWVDGVRFAEELGRATEKEVQGKWVLELLSKTPRTVRYEIEGGKEGLSGSVIGAPGETLPTDSTSVAARKLDGVSFARGVLRLTIPATAGFGEVTAVELERDGKILRGTAVSGGQTFDAIAKKVPKESPLPADLPDHSRAVPEWPPVAEAAKAPRAVLVKGATIWTSGPQGTLEESDLLVRDGKIARVGKNLSAPGGALVIEAEGRHVTAGLIDCHSHSDIAGGVNEGSRSCTAEVRIADVIAPRSPAMYRELAGGLTVSNLLHGSANTIGGQNAVIKLRRGELAEGLLMKEAPQGIKFALGENVKQSNWGEKYTTRYPQTRMGVEQFLRERFGAALTAREESKKWQGGRASLPPRRDLQLEALLEILDGDRLVHCHSYRADEILMLIRVADDFGFRIGTFQHVLEGYKCADEIAAHGAGASAFSDWWAYKYEVVDAIPYIGDILTKRGVLTSYNSDSFDLARRMNLEAAKAVKYGGVAEEEALKFVTFNPAKQLGIDRFVGSLEPGKDADFVLWSGHPLADVSVCLETWIDGVRHFSRAEDLAARTHVESLREKLLEKAETVRRLKKKADELRVPKEDDGESGSAFGRLYGEHSVGGCGGVAQGACIVEEGGDACSTSH